MIQSDFNESSLFIYGKSNPIKYGDNGGFDAVVLYNEDQITHIGVLVEDTDGNWYHFYWGAYKAYLFIPALRNIDVKVKAKLDYCNFDVTENSQDTLAAVNASGFYTNDYDHMVYLCGDFSKSFDYLKKTTEDCNKKYVYSIYDRNCSQVSLYALSISDTIYSERLLEASYIIFPKCSFKIVRRISRIRKGGIGIPLRPIPIVQ